MKLKRILFLNILAFTLCTSFTRNEADKTPGKILIGQMSELSADARDLYIEKCIIAGNYPDFMDKLVRVDVQTSDEKGKVIKGYYFVTPDYLCIGTDDDFIRMPMQPATAQRIANKTECFLPTRKISDDIYNAANVKLKPYPLTEDRESFHTFIKHNTIIEKQRYGRTGLIAGHKKDVIITHKLYESSKDDRVALYGWHKPDGRSIQSIYVGHINWYLDYSHGIRLVKDTIYIEGNPMHYTDVLKHPVYSKLICDEEICDYFVYPL